MKKKSFFLLWALLLLGGGCAEEAVPERALDVASSTSFSPLLEEGRERAVWAGQVGDCEIAIDWQAELTPEWLGYLRGNCPYVGETAEYTTDPTLWLTLPMTAVVYADGVILGEIPLTDRLSLELDAQLSTEIPADPPAWIMEPSEGDDTYITLEGVLCLAGSETCIDVTAYRVGGYI